MAMHGDKHIVLRLRDCLIIALVFLGFYFVLRPVTQRCSKCDMDPSPPHCESRDNPEGCVCPAFWGYGWSSNGKCIWRSPFGCSENGTCSNGLICSGGRCVCRFEDLQEYSREARVCFSKIGGPCGTEVDCVENAKCQENLYGSMGVCHCKPGYVENEDGHCDLEFGQNCSYPSFFHRPTSCDSAAGLVCLRGICNCPNFSVYNSTARACLGLIGAPCDISETEKMQCVEGAECSRSHPTFPGRCNCKKGFARQFDFTCGTQLSQKFFDLFSA